MIYYNIYIYILSFFYESKNNTFEKEHQSKKIDNELKVSSENKEINNSEFPKKVAILIEKEEISDNQIQTQSKVKKNECNVLLSPERHHVTVEPILYKMASEEHVKSKKNIKM
jgi:hypothetical protein